VYDSELVKARATDVGRLFAKDLDHGKWIGGVEFPNLREQPAHPELLDWLAAEFMDGWDMKRLVQVLEQLLLRFTRAEPFRVRRARLVLSDRHEPEIAKSPSFDC
jgi:Protein of unknown function (DUF1553)